MCRIDMCLCVPSRMPHRFCGFWIVHKPLKLWASLWAKEVVQCWKKLSRVEGVCLMSGVVVLTSRGWRACQAPKHGQVLSDVRCDNLNGYKRIAGRRGLSSPSSLDMCCLGCFCQAVYDGHVFGVSGKVMQSSQEGDPSPEPWLGDSRKIRPAM